MTKKFQISFEFKLLVVHIIFGVLVSLIKVFSTLLFFSALLFYLYKIFIKKKSWLIIAEAIIYLTSLEIFLRMNYIFLPWEIGKLSALFFLFIGIFRYGAGYKVSPFIFMLVFLLPGLLTQNWSDFRQARENVTFQLGGMLVLCFAGIFLKGRVLVINDISKLLLAGLLPAITLLVSITLKSPAISEITFGLDANFATSGGFGPNQVSTFLGYGLMVLVIHYIIIGPVWNRFIDILIMGFFLLRILFTFSRGGLIAALLPIIIAISLVAVSKGKVNLFLKTLFLLIPIGLGSFYFVNAITNGLLLKRFKGETYASNLGFKEVSLSSASSGRTEILLTDWLMFLDHPILGVGLGQSNNLRPSYGFENISHIEQSRLLAEHGIFGALVLLIMILIMITSAVKFTGLSKVQVVVFTLFSFLTMFHSATRMALPSFLFGFGFIILVNAKNTVPRKLAQ